MQKDTTKIELPSGVHLVIHDDDGRLQRCFTQLFGSAETGLAVVAGAVGKKQRRDDGRRR